MEIVAYDGTQEEYTRIVAEKEPEGLILTNVSNITEGNFLGFKLPAEIPPLNEAQATLEERLSAAEAENLATLEALAIVYEELLALKTQIVGGV